MSTDIRASENGLWCPRHSSLFSSGVKFWQPSELGTFVRRPRKAFFWEEKEKKNGQRKSQILQVRRRLAIRNEKEEHILCFDT